MAITLIQTAPADIARAAMLDAYWADMLATAQADEPYLKEDEHMRAMWLHFVETLRERQVHFNHIAFAIGHSVLHASVGIDDDNREQRRALVDAKLTVEGQYYPHGLTIEIGIVEPRHGLRNHPGHRPADHLFQ